MGRLLGCMFLFFISAVDYACGGAWLADSVLSEAPRLNQSKVTEQVQVNTGLSRKGVKQDSIKGQVRLRNQGNTSVWVGSTTIRSDGSTGFYLSLAENDPTTLELSSCLEYGPTGYDFSTNKAGVKLMLLLPNQERRLSLNIKTPLKETIPPYKETSERHKIDLSRIKYIRTCIGVLPDGEGIRKLLRSKYSPYHVNGLETVRGESSSSLRLFELQEVVCSPKEALD